MITVLLSPKGKEPLGDVAVFFIGANVPPSGAYIRKRFTGAALATAGVTTARLAPRAARFGVRS
jgi:hypothetical protein